MSKQIPVDPELSALIREASQWAAQLDHSKQGANGKTDEESFGELDPSLTAIANTITNYVTNEIMRRLVVPSEPTPPPMRGPTTPGRPLSRCTTRQATRRKSSTSSNYNKVASTPTTPIMSRSTLQRSTVYHSENRLDRFYPTPRGNETPLENKASRLRRLSTERRLKTGN